MAERPAVLIAAISARALAAAAWRAGFAPLVADLFGDLDTRVVAAECVRVSGSVARGLGRRSLLEALDRLADGRATEGVVYGSGFEARPSLLAAVARRHRLIGTPPEVVRRIKDPMAFAALCRQAGVPHPETRRTLGARGEWLVKRIGAAGGGHVRPVRRHCEERSDEAIPRGGLPRPCGPRNDSRHAVSHRGGSGHYYQRRVGGRAVSALFLADGRSALVLGFSEQWPLPLPGRPFRYGGAVRPASVPTRQAGQLTSAVAALVQTSGVLGLCSADFLLRSDGFDVLEINPRPGASLDVFPDREGRLFRLHLLGCGGRLPHHAPRFAGARAAAVVYARRNIRLRPGFAWPDWTADRQPAENAVPPGAPLCSVIADADTACQARRLAAERAATILAIAEAPA